MVQTGIGIIVYITINLLIRNKKFLLPTLSSHSYPQSFSHRIFVNSFISISPLRSFSKRKRLFIPFSQLLYQSRTKSVARLYLPVLQPVLIQKPAGNSRCHNAYKRVYQ